MGLLDSVIGSLGGQGGGRGQGLQMQLVQLLLSMLTQGRGGVRPPAGAGLGFDGLGGLLSQLQRAGLGDAASSWVGTGANQPVSPDALGQALGPDLIGQIARQLGVGQQEVTGGLSQVLPRVVDRLTPQGRVPEGGLPDIGDLGSLLDGLGGPGGGR
jgi:uncharacterized protein YidB (DUF937 family)